ncbi:winged helix-turn-helix transcriptional regulator [Bradyrhizobium sp. HKCCYLS1011]|uniref:winged helix-turn-helix transcriptional regulator n=1 Tax=Bradyrhizobium sp. HKCCYLS1011 TaxID=3420733 RepID=UPI003EBD0903
MDFMTSMENQTTVAQPTSDAGCMACTPDPALLATFQHAIRTISGKWKLEILFCLMDGPIRFGGLRRAIGGITQHMLTAQLRELEQDGLVLRTAFTEVPLRVEYQLTAAAYGLLPTFRAMLAWSEQYRRPA